MRYKNNANKFCVLMNFNKTNKVLKSFKIGAGMKRTLAAEVKESTPEERSRHSTGGSQRVQSQILCPT